MHTLLNRSTLLFISFLFSYAASAQHEFNDEVKGSVRYILEESFEGILKDSVIQKNGKNRQFSWIQDNKMEFDKKGRLITQSFYDDDRNHVRTETIEYKDDIIVKKNIQGFTFIYKTNEKGLVSEEILISKTDSTDIRLKQRFRYNELNQLVEILQFDLHGGYVCRQRNKYDAKGRLTKETFKYKDGVEYKNYMYGSDGMINKMEWYDFQLGLIERITYTYSRGKKLHEIRESLEKGRVETTITFEFDINENPISILEVNEKRRIHDHEVNEYVYDVGKNWIKKTTAINNNRYFIVERRIGYYL